MINLLDNVARHREWLAKRRLQGGFARACKARMKAELAKVGAAAASAYRAERSIDGALRTHAEDVQRIILSTLMATGVAFGKRARKTVGKEHGVVERKDTEEEMQARIATFARSRARTSMARVSATTQRIINRVIVQGVKDGDEREDIATQIEVRTGGQIGEARAAVIANTEVHTAANAGELEGVRSLDIPLRKEWLSMNDELVREDHQDVNGDEVELDDTFDVGGEALQYPGDPNGSPAQTVNCRCVMVYNEPKKS